MLHDITRKTGAEEEQQQPATAMTSFWIQLGWKTKGFWNYIIYKFGNSIITVSFCFDCTSCFDVFNLCRQGNPVFIENQTAIRKLSFAVKILKLWNSAICEKSDGLWLSFEWSIIESFGIIFATYRSLLQ